jgi:hypothetical protein
MVNLTLLLDTLEMKIPLSILGEYTRGIRCLLDKEVEMENCFRKIIYCSFWYLTL